MSKQTKGLFGEASIEAIIREENRNKKIKWVFLEVKIIKFQLANFWFIRMLRCVLYLLCLGYIGCEK